MMPSTPMKRVSRPTRIALSETKTTARASPSAPGSPSSCANSVSPLVAMSSAASTVRCAVEERVDRDVRAERRERCVEIPCSAPAISGR